MKHFAIIALAVNSFTVVIADPNDWVNPAYAIDAAKNRPADTSTSVQNIIRLAIKSSRDGPWRITNTTFLPPSGNARDYLSWAPYHWPDCNWCDSSHKNTSDPGAAPPAAASQPALDNSGDQQAGDGNSGDDNVEMQRRWLSELGEYDQSDARAGEVESALRARDTSVGTSENSPTATSSQTELAAGPHFANLAAAAPAGKTSAPPAAMTASRAAEVGRKKGPAVAATQKPSTTSKQASCTVSSTYVAPTETFSKCKYVQRDGKVNPDVRGLTSAEYMGKVTQASILNALAWIITRDEDYADVSASYIDAFFIDVKNGMNPNLNYGQVVRGPPGNQLGSFMAIVDLRGLTKVANAVQLLRQSNSVHWSLDRDRRMVKWAQSYMNWLQTSAQGKKSGTAANNHGTFFVNQMAALQILVGDYKGAKQTLLDFFAGPFKDQITATGEQPFEAIRTRPFHYRCFNLEALIVNAKLADQLGLDMWHSKSKYNATIQTAIDYTMRQDPGSEDATELVPHLLAAIAVYGDPKGRYISYVKKESSDYDTKPYYFYDQPGAFTQSSKSLANGKRKRDMILGEENGHDLWTSDEGVSGAAGQTGTGLHARGLSALQALHDGVPLSMLETLSRRLVDRATTTPRNLSSSYSHVLDMREKIPASWWTSPDSASW